MTPIARQSRLMRSLGFKCRERGNLYIWDHECGVVVQISRDYCPTAAEVMSHAIRDAARKAIWEVRHAQDAAREKVLEGIPRVPLVMMERRAQR